MPKGYAIEDTKNWTDFKVIDFDLKVCLQRCCSLTPETVG